MILRLVIELGMRTLIVVIVAFVMMKFALFNFDSFDGWIFRMVFICWAIVFPTYDFFKEIGLWKKKIKR